MYYEKNRIIYEKNRIIINLYNNYIKYRFEI
jgi:hypothetical protein